MIDDPFDLKGAFAGSTNMSHQKNLEVFTEQLVANYARYTADQYELHLEMLSEDDQSELARLYLESIDREIEGACYGDDDSMNSDFLCALLAMLKNDCKETRENFAKVTRKNILIYYRSTLDEILSAACDNFLHCSMNEQGYYANYDEWHGDVIWKK